jgi:hypothetical protein
VYVTRSDCNLFRSPNAVAASLQLFPRLSASRYLTEEMICEKFYRGRDQRMIIQGTGMGLPIAKAIVELHGGKLGVTSQLGRGTVFHFSLPAA